MNDNPESKSGIYILMILVSALMTAVLAGVKLTGLMDISLWIVFSPLIVVYFGLTLWIIIMIGADIWKNRKRH